MKNSIIIYLLLLPLSMLAQTPDNKIESFETEISEDGETYIYRGFGWGKTTFVRKESRDRSRAYLNFMRPDHDYFYYCLDLNTDIDQMLLPFISIAEAEHLLSIKEHVLVYPFIIDFFINMNTMKIDDVRFEFSGYWDRELFPISKLKEIEEVTKTAEYIITEAMDERSNAQMWESAKDSHLHMSHYPNFERIIELHKNGPLSPAAQIEDKEFGTVISENGETYLYYGTQLGWTKFTRIEGRDASRPCKCTTEPINYSSDITFSSRNVSHYYVDVQEDMEEMLLPFISIAEAEHLLSLKEQPSYGPFSIDYYINMKSKKIDDVQFSFFGAWDEELFPISKLNNIEEITKTIEYTATECDMKHSNAAMYMPVEDHSLRMSYYPDLERIIELHKNREQK